VLDAAARIIIYYSFSILFFIFAFAICGFIFYLFPPKHTVSFVVVVEKKKRIEYLQRQATQY